MASDLSVVAFDAEGVRDLVCHGETGLLVPPGDASAFAQALRHCLGSPERRVYFGARGRAVAEQHRWESVMDDLLNIYRQAIAGHDLAQAA
jgi:glycosyltransferase involved in cell wall biosynthesis